GDRATVQAAGAVLQAGAAEPQRPGVAGPGGRERGMSSEETPLPEVHQGERGLGDQIARYRTAFISLLAMIVVALLIGGYILTQERLSAPSWFQILGKEY